MKEIVALARLAANHVSLCQYGVFEAGLDDNPKTSVLELYIDEDTKLIIHRGHPIFGLEFITVNDTHR